MFLLYFNDIGNTVSPQTSIKLFAGDCLLYRNFNSASDNEQLQQDLNTMVEWSNTWLMRFNAAKCHLLTRQRKPLPTKYSNNNFQLQKVSHHPILGVELSFDLSWKAHISNITSKAKESLIFLDGISMSVNRKSNHKLLALLSINISNILHQSGTLTLNKTFWQ